MAKLDSNTVEAIIAKVNQVNIDAAPKWGKLTPAEMLGHLNAVVSYTMIEGGPQPPFKGNFKTRHIFRHIILNQIIEIPKGVRLPGGEAVRDMMFPQGTQEQLAETLRAFVKKQEACETGPCMHPFFGPLTGREWAKFHYAHIKHHLKQFGAWE